MESLIPPPVLMEVEESLDTPPKVPELSHEESSDEPLIEATPDPDEDSPAPSIQGQISHPTFYYEFPLIVDSEESFSPSPSNSSPPDQLSEDLPAPQFLFFPAVHYSDLKVIKKPHEKVKIVEYQGERYVYKYSYRSKHYNAFHCELRNYIKLAGMPGIPPLKAVVLNPRLPPDYPGLLISYIEGDDLQGLYEGWLLQQADLVDITERVVRLAADLEDRGFYHQDIKCNNILRRNDGEIFFIDFEQDVREGMYPAKWDKWIRRKRIVSPRNALFALGRTIWEFWSRTMPNGFDVQREMMRVPDEFVRRIYYSCLYKEVGSIRALHDKYYAGSEEMEARMAFVSEEDEAEFRSATEYLN
jgi:hypothetical protein